MMKHAILYLLFLSTSSGAQEVTNLQKVLLPITPGQISGAVSSIWSTQLTLTNLGGEAITVGFPYPGTCQLQCPTIPLLQLEPDTTRVFEATRTVPANVGVFLYVDDLSTMGLSLRSQDLSRQHQTWGTSIPVVHTEELFEGPFVLTDIPVDEQFRGMLRVYDVTPDTANSIIVRVHQLSADEADGGNVLVSAQQHDFRYPADDGQRLLHPGVVEISLSSVPLAAFSRIAVEVVPNDSDKSYWGFVSVTHNDTQHVTLVLPE